MPIKSKPALQKAEMEWNMEYHRPLTSPNRGKKRMPNKMAPSASTHNAAFRIHFVFRIIPPSFGAEIDCYIKYLCLKPIFLPPRTKSRMAIVMTPIPPI